MSHLSHVLPLLSLHELTTITDAYQWNAHDHLEWDYKRSRFPWWQSYHFVFDLRILFDVCAVWKSLFSWNRANTSKDMAI